MTTEERNLILEKYKNRKVRRHYTSKHRWPGLFATSEKVHLIKGNANIYTRTGRIRRNAAVVIKDTPEYWVIDLRLYSSIVAAVSVPKFNNRMKVLFVDIYSRTCISALSDFSRWLSDMTVISFNGNPVTYSLFKDFAKKSGSYEMLDSSVWFD